MTVSYKAYTLPPIIMEVENGPRWRQAQATIFHEAMMGERVNIIRTTFWRVWFPSVTMNLFIMVIFTYFYSAISDHEIKTLNFIFLIKVGHWLGEPFAYIYICIDLRPFPPPKKWRISPMFPPSFWECQLTEITPPKTTRIHAGKWLRTVEPILRFTLPPIIMEAENGSLQY